MHRLQDPVQGPGIQTEGGDGVCGAGQAHE